MFPNPLEHLSIGVSSVSGCGGASGTFKSVNESNVGRTAG